MAARETGRGADPGRAGVQGQTPKQTNRFITTLAIVSTLGGFLFGYDTGVIAGALLYLRDDLNLSPLAEGIVVSSLLLGAMLGALIGGKIADAYGRRMSIIACAVLFFVGALGSGFAPNVPLMTAARIVLGLAVGAASVVVPVYLAELAPTHKRGRIVALNEWMIVFGQLMAFAVNYLIDQTIGGQGVWRLMLSIAAIPAVFLFIGMFFMPDTPRWYAVRGRFDEAQRTLFASRDAAEAQEEYNIIVEHAKRDVAEDKGSAIADLREFPWMRRILWIGIGLAILQQTTGVNTLNYYGTTILERETDFGASAALAATISLGLTSVIAITIGIYLLGHVGRRTMLLIGFAAVTVAHALLALSFLLPTSGFRTYVILGCMLLFMFFMQAFLGLVVWVVLSEIFPMTIRGFAMGIATFALWTANTIISFAFPPIADALGPTGTFAVFVALNAFAWFFTYKFAPETRGRTLEELEDDFRSHDAAHFIHEAPVGVRGS